MFAKFRALAAAFIALCCASCDDGHLRGSVAASPDNLTYLTIADDNGGGCGPIFVDGKQWIHPKGVKSLIEPGEHGISCGSPDPEISFYVPPKVIFTFDYWGP
jgi:hypothetical protein